MLARLAGVVDGLCRAASERALEVVPRQIGEMGVAVVTQPSFVASIALSCWLTAPETYVSPTSCPPASTTSLVVSFTPSSFARSPTRLSGVSIGVPSPAITKHGVVDDTVHGESPAVRRWYGRSLK